MKYLLLLILFLSGVAQAQLTDHATGDFYQLPSGDLATTITGNHPNAFQMQRSDWAGAFDKVFLTTDTQLTPLQVQRATLSTTSTQVTTATLQIGHIRRRITAKFFFRLNPLYFFDNGILYKRADL